MSLGNARWGKKKKNEKNFHQLGLGRPEALTYMLFVLHVTQLLHMTSFAPVVSDWSLSLILENILDLTVGQSGVITTILACTT